MGDTSIVRYSDNESVLLFVSGKESITISNKTKTIFGTGLGDYAFKGSVNTLISFGFDSSPLLEIVSTHAFYGCKKIIKADFSSCSHLKEIHSKAFCDCTSLKFVSFPTSSSFKRIGDQVFKNTAVVDVFVPASVSSLGFESFASCWALKNFTLDPNSVLQYLQGSLFMSTNLSEFTVPKNVRILGAANFEFCGQLANVYVADGNSYCCSVDGVVYSLNKLAIIYFPAARTGTYSILDSVVSIGSSSFTSSKLSTVKFPSNLTSIRSFAFYYGSLISIELPMSLKIIEANAFTDQKKLVTVTIPEGVTTIGESCFSSCPKLNEVILPSTLTSLGGSAFSSCSPTIEIKFNANSSFYLDKQYIIINKANTSIIQYLGEAPIITIKNTIKEIKSSAFSGRKSIRSIIFEPTSSLQTIGQSAFAYCSGLVNFSLPLTVTSVGQRAFEYCSSLTSISFGPSLTKIGVAAFSQCTNIDSIVFSSSTKLSLDSNAFSYCSKLCTLITCEGIDSIGNRCFEHCYMLLKVEIPSTVTSMGDYCFYKSGIQECKIMSNQIKKLPSFMFCNCSSLKDFTIPQNVEMICSYSLSYSNISHVVIPTSVHTLEQFCFFHCESLVSFTIPENSNLTTFGFGVFADCSSFAVIDNFCANFEKENEALYNKGKSKFIVLPPQSFIRSFSFPPTLTTISESALYGCKKIFTVFIPDNSVKEIQTSAFENCINLRIINLPISVSKIGNNVFKGCKHLQCGLLIENKDSSFTRDLITISLLPRQCFKECQFACTEQQRKIPSITLISAFIFIFRGAY